MSNSIETMIEQAHARFDEMNAQDPQKIEVDGQTLPREVVFADRLAAWVKKRQPQPSVALRLAARCQHLQRFSLPRSEYPEGRVAYLTWRKDLSKRHADLATEVVTELGFDHEVIAQLRKINLKQELKQNPDSQAMEDALCLSFLEHDFAEFCEKYDDDKVIDIVKKTWGKMSEKGHELALTIPLTGRAQQLVLRALGAA